MKTGFKIVNDIRKKDLTMLMLDHLRKDQELTAEIGFYYESDEMDDILYDYFSRVPGQLSHHFQKTNTLFSLKARRKHIVQEVERAKQLNSDYSIIHMTDSANSGFFFTKNELISNALPLLTQLNQIGEDYHYAFYLENIYFDIPFYKQLFHQALEEGLNRIHFCFDIGHAKISSQNTIGEWYNFLKELEGTYGRSIHFHLHMNYGFEDDHLSLIEYMYSKGDWFSEGILYDHLLRDLVIEFQESSKIFEVKPEYAISNMNYVKRMLEESKWKRTDFIQHKNKHDKKLLFKAS